MLSSLFALVICGVTAKVVREASTDQAWVSAEAQTIPQVQETYTVAPQKNKGVCGDRRFDATLPWNGRVSPEGQMGYKPYLKYVYDHYQYKIGKLEKHVQNIALATHALGSGNTHLTSTAVAAVLLRTRGFEKCRGFSTLMGQQELYAGHSDKSHLDKDDTSPKEYEAKINKMFTEGDDCCDENCDPWSDPTCVPCGPVCKMNDNGSLWKDAETGVPQCVAQEKYCFERCSDFKCEIQGQCDCKDGGCRTCRGLKSVARHVSKELKLTLSFDVCGNMPGDGAERSKPGRQFCSVFRPDKCSIHLDRLLMRGDAWSTVDHGAVLDPMDARPPAQLKPLVDGARATVVGLKSASAQKLNGQRVLVLGRHEEVQVAEGGMVEHGSNGTVPARWDVQFADGQIMGLKAGNLRTEPVLDMFHHVFGAHCTEDYLDAIKASLLQVKMDKRAAAHTAQASLQLLEWAQAVADDDNDDGDSSYGRKWAGY